METLPEWASVPQQAVLTVLDEMFAASSLDLKPVARGQHGAFLEVELAGSDAEHTFGMHGKSLDALQYLANLVVARRVGSEVRVILDAAGYRERRADQLRDLAMQCANEVKARQEECELDPLPPHERRIVHTALKDHTDVVTYSEGEEPDRRVVIAPR